MFSHNSKIIDLIADEYNKNSSELMSTDSYVHEQLARAATCYVMPESVRTAGVWNLSLRYRIWPWSDRDWKSKDRIGDLVKAGALIVREIERLQQVKTK